MFTTTTNASHKRKAEECIHEESSDKVFNSEEQSETTNEKIENANKSKIKKIDFTLFTLYKKFFGDLLVPQKFVVPSDEDWPQNYHGKLFGRMVQRMRLALKQDNHCYFESDVKQLMEMGFVMDALIEKDSRILLAFQHFVSKFEHGNVPIHFTIKKTDTEWPEEVRGMQLGGILNDIKSKNMHHNIRQQLIDIGVDLTLQQNVLTFDQLHHILEIYYNKHGDVGKVTQRYVIPSGSDYPEHAWGYNLGRTVHNIRIKGTFAEHRDKLEALGLYIKSKVVKSTKEFTFPDICSAIIAYKAANGHVDIPVLYIVPSDNRLFPEHLHGLKLGQIVYGMRTRGVHAEHSERLLELGIVVDKKN